MRLQIDGWRALFSCKFAIQYVMVSIPSSVNLYSIRFSISLYVISSSFNSYSIMQFVCVSVNYALVQNIFHGNFSLFSSKLFLHSNESIEWCLSVWNSRVHAVSGKKFNYNNLRCANSSAVCTCVCVSKNWMNRRCSHANASLMYSAVLSVAPQT